MADSPMARHPRAAEARGHRVPAERAQPRADGGEKDAKSALKLGQLQLFIAVFPQECVGQLASFGPSYHVSRTGVLGS